MIITRSEVKSLLKITNTDQDSFIDLNLPTIEQVICDYCNTDFINKQFDYFSSGSISSFKFLFEKSRHIPSV